MSSIVVAGASSTSTTSTYTLPRHSLKTPTVLQSHHHQRTAFQGLTLSEAKSGWKSGLRLRRGLEIKARTAAKNIEVEVDKPLGLTLGQKPGGGVVITGVDGGGNAAKAGLKVGDQARATHICLDCGYIYTLSKSFDDQADTYVCPQCSAPKKRFARYDANTGKAIGGGLPPIGVLIGLVAGVAGVGALLIYGLQ
ncbi:hypothetical protein QJS10_CPA01g03005 [Acorus calamus]|uniref:Rubredoxin-like domain-containing protein n=1 Tax=Acorus calamus TaxID=4465 RepID=A0AAV9FLP9_ACOCL|nr:hypothetical protein QJS10_CPA01g03005 [Acorus calamus]